MPVSSIAAVDGISKAAFHRRKGAGGKLKLKQAESDRVVRFARLLGKAAQVFPAPCTGTVRELAGGDACAAHHENCCERTLEH